MAESGPLARDQRDLSRKKSWLASLRVFICYEELSARKEVCGPSIFSSIFVLYLLVQRTQSCLHPYIDFAGIWQEYNASGEGSSQLVLLKPRKPQWSDSAQAWTLNFKGRVKLASKKNFMLVDKSDESEGVLMLFGR